MKTRALSLSLIILIISSLISNAQDAKEIVKKADIKFQGEKSSKSQMKMKIIRPSYTRTLEFKNWTEEKVNSMTLITAPAKEAGQSFLKIGNNMWNWNPTIQRLIKLPPSMMSQGWMGSDYTNDDILKESSIVVDYTHQLNGKETINGYQCYKIILQPKPEADVVWGKIIMWISEEDYFQIKTQYFDEENYLIKTHIASNIKQFDDRKLPSKMEIIPAEEENQRTIVEIISMDFNIDIPQNFFSQQNMKRLR